MRENGKKFLDWVDGKGLYGLDNVENFSDRTETAEKLSETDEAGSAETRAVEAKIHHEKTFRERYERFVVNNERGMFNALRPFLSVILAVVIIACLLMTTSYLPSFGDPDNPVNNEVSQRYIESGLKETGGMNIVGGMILDYRAFDTLGESHVLFIAVCAVVILLRNDRKKKGKSKDDPLCEPKPDVILQKGAMLIVPMVLMFGVYIVLNGHLSPGGGFSGGTVMGAALILYYNAFGSEKVSKFFTYKTFNRISISALGFYAIAKSYAFYTGANGIHSFIPLGTPGAILSSGLILYLNIAVGVIVCCTMFGFYSLFAKEAI